MELSITKNKVAEAGISAMIIFIASILVSAVVATLLIENINSLRQQAENTGMEAIGQISNGVSIYSMIGDRKEDSNASVSSSDSIQVLKVGVKLISGSDNIDLNNLLVEINSNSNSVSLSYNASGTSAAHANANSYIVIPLLDSDSSISSDHIITQGDKLEIIISFDEDATNITAGQGDSISMSVMPLIGIDTEYHFTITSIFINRYIYIA